jgi:hypothetical protein
MVATLKKLSQLQYINIAATLKKLSQLHKYSNINEEAATAAEI